MRTLNLEPPYDSLDPMSDILRPVFQTQGKESAAQGVARAAREAEIKLALHGSIARWPTLSLLPNQFPFCRCGHKRNKHRWNGCSLDGCGQKGCKCDAFEASALRRGP